MILLGHWLLLSVGLSLAACLYLVLGRDGFWHAQPLPDADPPSQQRPPDVVVVMPARNEAPYIARSLGSLTAQDYPGRLDVVLVDDHSEDRTREVAKAVPTRPGRSVEVIGARPLPTGGSGKLWAVSEGLRYASRRLRAAPYVLLTDADVEHGTGP